ncbi:NAD(P)H-dependent oxidoreductase [Plantactinospora sp. S1510]|uniref:NAD(P)H-dependent oxidoreductase n=1 Tax=Plantactinospora alkalitolerans TaxID=2789879 RepID=A0ABS0GPH6_9ACTN|nr:NAD(P)H-dependent oxidoreductase [Plantactinospora alkalitolerans]MBF9128091.1 NAD(P)H-dependent oxidoreductase [Plantactinospora alkalitolerans]
MQAQADPDAIHQTDQSAPPRVAIIVGSTRPGRKADTVARWVLDIALRRDDATFEVVDIADHALPHLDEPIPARQGQYAHAHTRDWAEKIGSFDSYVFVTPEYNGSIPGTLKNAIDFLYAEWNDKVAGFIGYGIQGGVRAIEHLRLILSDLNVTGVHHTIALTFAEDFEDYTQFTPSDPQEKNLTAMLDELVTQTLALRGARPTT